MNKVTAIDRARVNVPLEARWLTTSEAAVYGGTHVETVRDALRSRALHGIQRTKAANWKTRTDWVDAWVNGVKAEVAA